MSRKFIPIGLAMITLILTYFLACETKPTAPERDNPFDPKNISEKGAKPIAKFTALQTSYFPLIIYFDASQSKDYEDSYNLQYRWDFNGDDIYDTNWLMQDTIIHQYVNAGTFKVVLSVKDQSGLINDDIHFIEVKPPLVDMIFIQGGTFQMGDSWGDGDSDEKPVHTVTVNSFYIGKYEVTQAQYQEIIGSNPSYFKGANRPVEKVTWYDAVQFCNKLSEREWLEPCYMINGTDVTCDFSKNGYRLPTEAEWEYAARGGNHSQGYKYSGSDNPDEVAWYSDNSGSQTHEVGAKQPNELGLYDMSGNVWEWCWDWYASDYYNSKLLDNPIGPPSGNAHVLRSGSSSSGDRYVRVANRDNAFPSDLFGSVGFRLLRMR